MRVSLALKHGGLSRAEKRPMLLHARTPHDHGSVVDIINYIFSSSTAHRSRSAATVRNAAAAALAAMPARRLCASTS